MLITKLNKQTYLAHVTDYAMHLVVNVNFNLHSLWRVKLDCFAV